MMKKPPPLFLHSLAEMANDPKNSILILSGFQTKFMEEWLGDLPIGKEEKKKKKKRKKKKKKEEEEEGE